jgi:hypothetical protein
MATPAQIAANRANAQKSTGPRSAEGKSASRFNALKHSLDAESIVLPTEDPVEYQTLADEYFQTTRPQTPDERFHVETMIRADWQKRRLARVEADLYRTVLSDSPGASLAEALLADTPATKLLARVQRQLAAFERAWYRAHTQLHRAREAAAANHDRAFEAYLQAPSPVPVSESRSHELASFPQFRVSPSVSASLRGKDSLSFQTQLP